MALGGFGVGKGLVSAVRGRRVGAGLVRGVSAVATGRVSRWTKGGCGGDEARRFEPIVRLKGRTGSRVRIIATIM